MVLVGAWGVGGGALRFNLTCLGLKIVKNSPL